jgi:hypothetical protein
MGVSIENLYFIVNLTHVHMWQIGVNVVTVSHIESVRGLPVVGIAHISKA